MGFMDKLKRGLSGPLDVTVDAPESFSCAQASVPVRVTITNPTFDSIEVREIEVSLKRSGTSEEREVELREGFLLGPGITEVRTVEIPLVVDASPEALGRAAQDAGLPAGVGSMLGRFVKAPPPLRPGRHEIEVEVELVGTSRECRARRPIQAI